MKTWTLPWKKPVDEGRKDRGEEWGGRGMGRYFRILFSLRAFPWTSVPFHIQHIFWIFPRRFLQIVFLMHHKTLHLNYSVIFINSHPHHFLLISTTCHSHHRPHNSHQSFLPSPINPRNIHLHGRAVRVRSFASWCEVWPRKISFVYQQNGAMSTYIAAWWRSLCLTKLYYTSATDVSILFYSKAYLR